MIAKNRAIDSVLSLQMLCLFELPVFRDGFIDGELAPSDIEGSDSDLGRKVVFDSDDFRLLLVDRQEAVDQGRQDAAFLRGN